MAFLPTNLAIYHKSYMDDPSQDGTRTYTFIHNHVNGNPFVTLKLYKLTGPNVLPAFAGDQLHIQGVVELDSDKAKDIKSIDVFLNGQIISSGIDTTKFAETRQTLWNRAMGDPQMPHSPDPQLTSQGNSDLQGSYVWPFSISLPQSLILNHKESKSLGLSLEPDIPHPLPPSLTNTEWGSFIQYQVGVDVISGKLFGSDVSVRTPIAFTPTGNLYSQITSENDEVKGKWRTFEDITIGGKFSGNSVEIKCSLYLPEPLFYQRGTVIDLLLTLSSPDTQILDIFSNPEIPIVELHQKLKRHIGVTSVGSALQWRGVEKTPTAKWQQVDSSGADTTTRMMKGTLAIPASLPPTFTFGDTSLHYVLDVLPFKVEGFKPVSADRAFRTDIGVTI